MRVRVDGEAFEVRERSGEPGTYDLEWVSAPAPRYGFSIARNDRSEINAEEMTDAIRGFLASVDPETGHIE